MKTMKTMKKIKFLSVMTVIALGITSCSDEDGVLATDQNAKLLKTFKVQRDATGAYSVDFNVSDNTEFDKVLNKNDNTRQYFLYSSDKTTENNISHDLSIKNDQVKIGFVDMQSTKSKSITIIDDINFARKSSNPHRLLSYSVVSNENGLYDLDFTVMENTNVSFVYNDELKIHEVHLRVGTRGEVDFSTSLEKLEGESLKIDFVNHIGNPNAKSYKESLVRKPRVIVDTGD
ncbi:MAG: hypothetical protein ACJA1B_000335 [Polaribacter sp.]|jgi:hypothetical protein